MFSRALRRLRSDIDGCLRVGFDLGEKECEICQGMCGTQVTNGRDAKIRNKGKKRG